MQNVKNYKFGPKTNTHTNQHFQKKKNRTPANFHSGGQDAHKSVG